MDFYTNVNLLGNKIAYRGIENGKQVSRRMDYHPTVFVPTNKDKGWTSLNNEKLAPYQPGNIKDTRDFLKNYDDVENVQIYGNTNWVTEFIAEHFSEEIEFDSNLIRKFIFDIEVSSEQKKYSNDKEVLVRKKES